MLFNFDTHSISVTSELFSSGKTIYAVGSDGEIKEVMNGVVRTAQLVEKEGLNGICISNSDLMLFLTGSTGIIYSLRLPIKETPDFVEFSMHSDIVNEVKISNIVFSYSLSVRHLIKLGE